MCRRVMEKFTRVWVDSMHISLCPKFVPVQTVHTARTPTAQENENACFMYHRYVYFYIRHSVLVKHLHIPTQFYFCPHVLVRRELILTFTVWRDGRNSHHRHSNGHTGAELVLNRGACVSLAITLGRELCSNSGGTEQKSFCNVVNTSVT